MYCTIPQHNKAGYTAMPDPESGPYARFNDFWVCAECHLPTRMVFNKLTDQRAPARATHISSVVGDSAGRNILTWGTPTSGEKIKTMMFHPYPRKADMDQGRNICLELWQKLDYEIDTIRAATAPELVEYNKNRATTLSEVIALIMQPFYADATAVLQESMTRWTARSEGRDHESPGLAEAIWDPLTRFDGTPYSRENEAKARSGGAKTAPKVVLDEQKVTFIKHTLATGAMAPEVLAGMFSCTVEDIKAANDS